MVVGLGGEDAFERLRLEVAVLVPADDVGGERLFVLQKEQFFGLPSAVRVVLLLPCILRTDVLANFLCIHPRALRVDVDFVQFA